MINTRLGQGQQQFQSKFLKNYNAVLEQNNMIDKNQDLFTEQQKVLLQKEYENSLNHNLQRNRLVFEEKINQLQFHPASNYSIPTASQQPFKKNKSLQNAGNIASAPIKYDKSLNEALFNASGLQREKAFPEDHLFKQMQFYQPTTNSQLIQQNNMRTQYTPVSTSNFPQQNQMDPSFFASPNRILSQLNQIRSPVPTMQHLLTNDRQYEVKSIIQTPTNFRSQLNFQQYLTPQRSSTSIYEPIAYKQYYIPNVYDQYNSTKNQYSNTSYNNYTDNNDANSKLANSQFKLFNGNYYRMYDLVTGRIAGTSNVSSKDRYFENDFQQQEDINDTSNGLIRRYLSPSDKFRPKLVEDQNVIYLLQYLKNLLNFENRLEQIRNSLAKEAQEEPGFSLIDLFRVFDENGSGFLTYAEMMKGLQQVIGVQNLDQNDVFLLFARYGHQDNDSRLSYSEFCQMIIPGSELNKELLLNPQPRLTYNEFSLKCKQKILDLFKNLLNTEFSCEKMRNDLQDKKIQIWPFFNRIDANNSQIISSNELKSFLEINGLSNIDIIDFRNVLGRFDTNQTGKISKKEYESELQPRLKKQNQ